MSEDGGINDAQHPSGHEDGVAAPQGLGHENLYSSERAKAFIDAVVAIAMTLLILPLMESANEIDRAETSHRTASYWLNENSGALWAFAISFAVIGMFWITHHRLFARVQFITGQLIWLNIAWLFSIVWIPVATALTGALDSSDLVAVSIYIGSMIFTSTLILVLRLYLRAHPKLHTIEGFHLVRGIAADITMMLLFAIALVVAITVPPIGYAALFLTALTGPVQSLLARMLGAPSPPKIKRRKRTAQGHPDA